MTADQLTLPMRVLAVADVYEALTSDRPYRPAMSSVQALGIIRAQSPHRLDDDAVAALAGLVHDPGATPGASPTEQTPGDEARIVGVLDRVRAPAPNGDPATRRRA